MSRQGAEKEGGRQGDFVGGTYLLEECLGIGGMGEVYRATNVSLGRKVAIKLLNKEHTANEDDVLRFLREARAAAAVRHPNVVDVFDVARDDDGTPFIVQELLSGEDLEQYLGASRGGAISAQEALAIMIPVVDALAAAHARDVVHRDLKPANIFLAREGNRIVPKVLDFGACLYQTVGALSAKERRMLIGTPHYMAPEQITTAMDVDARADVWAMGVLLYEMLVGATPFEADDATAVLKLVRTRAVPSVRKSAPHAPERLDDLVQRCLDRDRRKRFPNAAAVGEELNAIQNDLSSKGPQKRLETIAESGPDLPPARNEPKSNVLRGAKKYPSSGSKLGIGKLEDESPSSPRVPSLSLKGSSAKAKRRGSSLLMLSALGDDDLLDVEPPASASRPMKAAPRADAPPLQTRTAADVIREAEEAMANNPMTSMPVPEAPDLPPHVSSAPPSFLASSAPGGINSLSSPVPSSGPRGPSAPPSPPRQREPGAPRDLDFDDADHDLLNLDLNLDLGPRSVRHGAVSSIPPVLDPRSLSAGRIDLLDRPSSSSDLDEKAARSSAGRMDASARPPSLDPPPSRRSGRPSTGAALRSDVMAPWTVWASTSFALTLIVPAVVASVAVRQAPFITAPLGHAMRGDSPLASGVLAVASLIGAAALASKSLGSSRSNALLVAAVGSVLAGIVMIIVTFSASETADLEIPPPAAAIVPFIGPIIPLGLGLAAIGHARGLWRSRYERREALTFVLLASLMLFAVLELGPFGAVSAVSPASGTKPAASSIGAPGG